MTKTFEKPPIARQHCRFYHYDRAPDGTMFGEGGGPRCEVGVDLTAPAAALKCMPPHDNGAPRPACDVRQEWSEAERGVWEAFQKDGQARLVAALQVLPRPIPMRSGGTVACPSCDGGTIRYDRWHRGASLACTTPYCCNARFSISEPSEWPAPKKDSE